MDVSPAISILVVTGGFYGELGTGHLRRSVDFLSMLQRAYPCCKVTVAVNNDEAKRYLESWFEAFPGELVYWDQISQLDRVFTRVLCDCLDGFDLNDVSFDSAIAVDSRHNGFESNVTVLNYLIGAGASPIISHIPFPKSQIISCIPEAETFALFGYFGGDINEIYSNRRKILHCIIESIDPLQSCQTVSVFLPLEPSQTAHLKMLRFLRRALRLKDPSIFVNFDCEFDIFLGRSTELCNVLKLRWVCSPGLFGLNLIRCGENVQKFCSIHEHQRECESILNLLKSDSREDMIQPWINWLECFGEINFDDYFLGKRILWIKISLSRALVLELASRLRSLEHFFLPLYRAKHSISKVVFEYVCSIESDQIFGSIENCDVTPQWVDKLTFTAQTEPSRGVVTINTVDGSMLDEFPEELLEDIRKIETTDKVVLGGSSPHETSLQWFLKSMESKSEEALAFLQGNKIIGICTILNLGNKKPRVGLFLVATPYRNRGCSSKCLDALLDYLNRRGMTSVSITAIGSNEKAVNAYSSHPRFELTRRERSYFYVR